MAKKTEITECDKVEVFKDIPLEIKIKYFDEACKITELDQGNWIDLRSAIDKPYTQGEFFYIPLGVAMQLPQGYEAHLIPRSSTFKNFGLIQTNHMGCIDNSFCGDEDQWLMPVFAMRKGEVKKGDRICQFRIMPIMPKVKINEVEKLKNPSRGGFGSTGIK